MKKTFWAIRVGSPSNGYLMDNKAFSKRSEAKAFLETQLPCPWSSDWHIVKLQEVQP